MSILKAIALWALARLREPSTYAGFAGLVMTTQIPHASEVAGVIPQIGTGVIGLLSLVAVLMSDKKP